MDYFAAILVVVAGLAVGSFLNVVIYRLPRKKGLAFSRSVCPRCGRQLKWYHNIPLLSYLVLRGRCAFCSAPISLRYPLVEAANAALYLFFFWRLGFEPTFFVFSLLGSALIAVFFIDLDFMIIPDSITLSGIVVGLAVSFLPNGLGPVNSLVGLLVGGGALYLIAVIGDWMFKKESMGGGDIKLSAMLGAFLGWEKVVLIFIASAFIGLVVSVVIMIFSARLRETRTIPFGPFLALAAVLSICYGQQIIDYYVAHFLGL
ncbi:MAG: prepilin peptidase [Candidatus Zixiibacteriota bacterium]|nr:MAG: prepilin peptidase [candidate division Zixibacteria bacterium]